jgi:hypothetical protein
MKWGTRYGPEYVNLLYSMVKRHTQRPLRFVCFTDDTHGIESGVETQDLPPIEIPQSLSHKPWRKLSLWQKDLAPLQGDILFFDLDILVTGNIDQFFDYRPELSFCVIHNWTTKNSSNKIQKIAGNTSCFRFRAGHHHYLFDYFETNPNEVRNRYGNEQVYISNEISEIDYWPDEWCVSFKHSLLPTWPQRMFREAQLPPKVKVVAFTGKPDIDDVIAGTWPEKSILKRPFKRFVKPQWVEAHWR